MGLCKVMIGLTKSTWPRSDSDVEKNGFGGEVGGLEKPLDDGLGGHAVRTPTFTLNE